MTTAEPFAIVDIGSNSVRLVVYSGPRRVPAPIFNEKVLAGLGAGLAQTGELSPDSQEIALAALRRYRLLLDHMRIKRTRVLATAAVRDARNGPQFARLVKKIGFNVEVLSPEDEARLAGEGVLSAVPGADGIVGDLGGGSLELADVRDGAVRNAISLPLGVLRIANEGKSALATLRAALKDSDMGREARGRSFYMVGGSWRALAQIDMVTRNYPLAVKHQYSMPPARAETLRKMAGSLDVKLRKSIAPARLATSPVAAMLLSHLVDELRPGELVLSSFGIREGLLFSTLGKAARAQDPLIEAARASGGAGNRFGEHGDILDDWISPVFDDPARMSRLRLASCLLADVAWQATPDFRADRGVEMALHGNWVAVDTAGRVMMAQALSSNFGRDKLPSESLRQLCKPSELERARQWGLAMRLGQRLCGGVGSALNGTSLSLTGDELRLQVCEKGIALVGGAVRRRLSRLADSLGRSASVVVG
ncbi:MAG: Ppx/GppA family phosphatase [Sphingomonas sp.]|nr:Ppx/GppA family phosphatase [Sphingomonas sp.]